jgi:hypothetical protein
VKATMDGKWAQLEIMLRDGMDPVYIMRHALPRISMRDLQILHQCYLRDQDKNKNGMMEVSFRIQ